VWYSSASLLPAILCSWAGGLPLGQLLGLAFGDLGIFFGLWAAGPLGLLGGLIWARRNRHKQRALFANPVIWWLIGAIALVLLLAGVWLGGQIMETGQPMKKQALPPQHKSSNAKV
jgi:hypothetical protein